MPNLSSNAFAEDVRGFGASIAHHCSDRFLACLSLLQNNCHVTIHQMPMNALIAIRANLTKRGVVAAAA